MQNPLWGRGASAWRRRTMPLGSAKNRKPFCGFPSAELGRYCTVAVCQQGKRRTPLTSPRWARTLTVEVLFFRGEMHHSAGLGAVRSRQLLGRRGKAPTESVVFSPFRAPQNE
jgi:hypothetical protein